MRGASSANLPVVRLEYSVLCLSRYLVEVFFITTIRFILLIWFEGRSFVG